MLCATKVSCVEPNAGNFDLKIPICYKDTVEITNHPYEWMKSYCCVDGGNRNRIGLVSFALFLLVAALGLCSIWWCLVGTEEYNVEQHMHCEGHLSVGVHHNEVVR